MKKNLILFAALAFSAVSYAQDDLTVKLTDGNKVYKIDDLKSITFENNKLNVNKQNNSAEVYTINEVAEVVFTMTDGVNNLKLGNGKLQLSVNAGSDVIRVSGCETGKSYSVGVYDLQGKKILAIDNWNGDDVNVGSLPHGVYVFKINETTLKFRK